MSRLGWKIFAVVELLWLPFWFGFGSEGFEDVDWFRPLLQAIVVVGLVGYAWDVRIGQRWMWKGVVAFQLLGLIIATPLLVYFAYVGLQNSPATTPEPWLSLKVSTAVIVAISLLELYPIFRYAFREHALWVRSPGGVPPPPPPSFPTV